MLTESIHQLIKRENLTLEESQMAAEEIILGKNIPQISAFMSLLRCKGETSEETLGIVTAFKKKMLTINMPYPVLDIVGTGGDYSNSINISTGAAILAASCGVKIVKHGGHSTTSQCGSADVLHALGVNIELTPEQIATCVEETNFGFCYAPFYHPAFKHVKDIRKQLGIMTIFNILAPLLNPASAEYLMIGIAQRELMDLIADVVLQLPIKRAFIFHCNGLDEITTIAPTHIIDVQNSCKKYDVIDPEIYGFRKGTLEDLRGGSAEYNAAQLMEIFSGESEIMTDTLVLNAAIAQYLYGSVSSIQEGIKQSKLAIESNKALATFKKFRNLSRSFLKGEKNDK